MRTVQILIALKGDNDFFKVILLYHSTFHELKFIEESYFGLHCALLSNKWDILYYQMVIMVNYAIKQVEVMRVHILQRKGYVLVRTDQSSLSSSFLLKLQLRIVPVFFLNDL